MSLSSILADVKHVLADLPTIRTTVVAALAAAGSVVGLLAHASPGAAAVAGVITAVATFLASPKVIQILNDIASAAAAPVKSVFHR